MSIKKNTKEKGQVLVEVMVALSVTLISITGFLGLLKTSFALNTVSAKNYTAVYLATEGIEIMKQFVDNTFFDRTEPFNGGLVDGACYRVEYATTNPIQVICESSQPAPMKHGPSGVFNRIIRVDFEEGGDVIVVTSKVTWEDKESDFEVVLEDRFYNWWQNF